jgi:hypothetical protein
MNLIVLILRTRAGTLQKDFRHILDASGCCFNLMWGLYYVRVDRAMVSWYAYGRQDRIPCYAGLLLVRRCFRHRLSFDVG